MKNIRIKLANFFHSIRFRLTLWFGLVLALILIGFSFFVYYRQSQDAYDQASSRLAVRIAELDRAFARSLRYEGEGAWLSVPGTSTSNSFLLREGEVIVLTNQAGQVATFSGPVSKNDAEVLAQIAKAQKPNNRISIYQLAPETTSEVSTYLFISAPVGYNNRIVGWVTLGQQLDPGNQLTRLRWTLILTATVTLIIALAGGYLLANRALKPVKTITRTAQEISETDLNQRINNHTQDELGELATTFDQMLDRLQAAFNRQRQFTADASHELRTPLTIIGLETSRALHTARTGEDYRQALDVIHSENEFMSRMVDELLVLARMDAEQVQLKNEDLDLSDLVLEIVERYAPIAAQKGIGLETGDLPELLILGDRQYIIQMISNLVDNAIKYSPRAITQPIFIETGISQEHQVPTGYLRVKDHGPGIAEEHLSHLFERFYRVDSARSHNQDEAVGEHDIPGSGLGLAIVQRIVKLHNGTIQVSSQVGQGSTFKVFIPLKQVK